MRGAHLAATGLLLVLLGGSALGGENEIALPQELTAIVEREDGRISGTRRIQVSIRVESVALPETARELAGLTRSGGQQSLLDALRRYANGRITLGALEYPMNLVVVKPSDGGG